MELSIIAVVIDNLEITKRFVSSVRQYSGKDYELILIDNASKDKKAVNFIKKSADVYYRFNKRINLSKAWNKGIQLAKGKYVAIVNNDTIVPPDWFKPLKQTLVKNKKAGMVSPITYWIINRHFNWGKFKNFDKTFSKPFKLIKFKDLVWGEFCVFKRKALEDVDGYCEEYKDLAGEDLDINFRLYKKGYKIFIDPRVFVYHQGRASQIPSIISKRKRNKCWKQNFDLFKTKWPQYTRGMK